ncbi:hypothetical protein KEM52_004704 [Ascosphaera acerosa]|nr:hypothetical protein KEM52_004704 [Ascosphaera acerosa]
MDRTICYSCLARLAARTPRARPSLPAPFIAAPSTVAVRRAHRAYSRSIEVPVASLTAGKGGRGSQGEGVGEGGRSNRCADQHGHGKGRATAAEAAAAAAAELANPAISSHERHLNSILSHPLFRLSPSAPSPSSLSPTLPSRSKEKQHRQLRRRTGHGRASADHHDYGDWLGQDGVVPPSGAGRAADAVDPGGDRHPLATLDGLIAAGRADERALDRCLRQYFRDLIASAPSMSAPPPHLLAASPAAATVQAWYSSATEDARLAALRSRTTVALVMPFLVCARRGRQMAMAWLRDLVEMLASPANPPSQKQKQKQKQKQEQGAEADHPRDGGSDLVRSLLTPLADPGPYSVSALTDCASNVLVELLAAELRYHANLDTAVDCLSQACEVLAPREQQQQQQQQQQQFRRGMGRDGAAVPGEAGTTPTSPRMAESHGTASLSISETSQTGLGGPSHPNFPFPPLHLHSSPLRRGAILIATWISDRHHAQQPPRPLAPSLTDAATFARLQPLLTRLLGEHHFWSALTPLYHPLQPDAGPATRFGRRHFERFHAADAGAAGSAGSASTAGHEKASVAPPSVGVVKARTPRQRHYLLRMCLRAGQVCLEKREYADAGWYLQHAARFLDPPEHAAPATGSVKADAQAGRSTRQETRGGADEDRAHTLLDSVAAFA